jgi:hypothetical protein
VYVAAGGGGDALAASIVAGALGDDPTDLVIATWAWDRLIVDPLPGPRSPGDFTGLEPIGRRNHRITPATQARPPSGSTLPALAAALPGTLALLDPARGAQGVRSQISELVELYRPERLTLIDVGGDLVARGREPGLKSPLADGLALASLPTGPVRALIAGAGLDGELPESAVLGSPITGPLTVLTERDVAEYRPVFDWHPSEATALLVAAARGCRGIVEIRDAGHSIPLTDQSPAIYEADATELCARSPLATALVNTRSLDEVETTTRHICGFSEIDYERTKAAKRQVARSRSLANSDLDLRISILEQQARERNATYVTTRRIAEALQLRAGLIPELRQYLLRSRPANYVWPLWKIDAAIQPRQSTPRSASKLA